MKLRPLVFHTMAAPLPLIVRDDRPSPTLVARLPITAGLGYYARATIRGGSLAHVVITTGRRCTLCEAWAASYARLRHADGCKGADCG